jgi:hypothetical protein
MGKEEKKEDQSNKGEYDPRYIFSNRFHHFSALL